MASPTHDDPYEFARVHPEGLEAEKALGLVLADEELHPYHKSFIQVVPTIGSDESESETSSSGRPGSPRRERENVYYKLSLADKVEHFAHGWRAGRGSSETLKGSNNAGDRSVDLLLIRPGQCANRVAPVHARIRFNPHSGALMLVGADKALEHGQFHVLYQRSNTFRVGDLYYTLVFTAFDADQYTKFVTRRNEILGHYGFPAPHSSLSAVWRHQDTKIGSAILHSSFAFGTYGWVHAAVHSRTGQPLAIKRHLVQSRKQFAAVKGEVKVGLAFNEEQGLMPIYKSWCEHEAEHVCSVFPQQICTSSPLAMHDFSRLQASGLSTRELIEFLRGPLEGLANLHEAGYIHRDVSMKNIFVLSLNPPRAVLGDFGKTIRAQSHKDRQIGPIKTLAPEVDGSTYYDAKIDIWSWGVVFMCAFAPFLNHLYERMSTPQWHHRATDWLAEKENELGLDSLAAQLIRCVLAKDPEQRPSAARTLEHPCFHRNTPRQPGSSIAPRSPHGYSGIAGTHNEHKSGSKRAGGDYERELRPVYNFKRNRHRRLQDASMPKRLTSLDSNLNSKLNSNPPHTQHSHHQYYLPRQRAYSHHYCTPGHHSRPPTARFLREIVLQARMAKVGSTFTNDDKQQADHPSRHREGYYDADEQARLTDHGLSPTNFGD
ncbi:MAG: hypothetical protein L6R35_006680 [Caloplaca aegaea]|nr:MAG: hypothetical protein L6R35_006680 [Caloplaca aegaea]